MKNSLQIIFLFKPASHPREFWSLEWKEFLSGGILHIPDSRASLSRSGLHLPDLGLGPGTQQQHKEEDREEEEEGSHDAFNIYNN